MSEYTYWQNALAGDFGAVHDSDPQPGFYRRRFVRGGPYAPAAIWEAGGQMICLVNGKQVDAASEWTYLCQSPIPEEWYHAKMRGEPWPDEDAAVAESLAPPPMGDNLPPQDEAEIMRGQIEAASAGIKDYAEIKDDETAARAQSLRSRLLELSGTADKKREAEKRPHLEAGKAIDGKWQPLVKAAKEAADAIRKALGAHETRKDQERRTAEAARQKAEQEAQRKRLEAEAAGKPLPPKPEPPPPAPFIQPTIAIKGAYGRAAAVKAVKIAIVKSYDEATAYFRDNAEYRAVIDRLAQRAADAGFSVPGVEIEERKDVR